MPRWASLLWLAGVFFLAADCSEVCVVNFDNRFSKPQASEFVRRWSNSSTSELLGGIEREGTQNLPYYALAARANLLYAAYHGYRYLLFTIDECRHPAEAGSGIVSPHWCKISAIRYSLASDGARCQNVIFLDTDTAPTPVKAPHAHKSGLQTDFEGLWREVLDSGTLASWSGGRKGSRFRDDGSLDDPKNAAAFMAQAAVLQTGVRVPANVTSPLIAQWGLPAVAPHDRIIANTGVLLIRNSVSSREVIDVWWEAPLRRQLSLKQDSWGEPKAQRLEHMYAGFHAPHDQAAWQADVLPVYH